MGGTYSRDRKVSSSCEFKEVKDLGVVVAVILTLSEALVVAIILTFGEALVVVDIILTLGDGRAGGSNEGGNLVAAEGRTAALGLTAAVLGDGGGGGGQGEEGDEDD